MKIKIITCHDVYNVGASLQAYALQTYLKSLGHDVKTIDYKPDYLSKHYRLDIVGNPKYDKPLLKQAYLLAKLPGRLRMLPSKEAFDNFTAKYLDLTRRYTSNEELKKEPPEANLYFAGSDQIWNTAFPNGRDPAFYLDFAPNNTVKASYAASFATEDILEEWKPQVKQLLAEMNKISVREKSGLKIVEELGIPNAVQVLDPVFLLDRNFWASIEQPLKHTRPYVLLYDFDQKSEMVQFARRLANKNGWELYSVLSCNDCDRCFSREGPLTFISLVHHAEFVVSNSFHATAFSLIFQKQFIVFDRNEEINTRMRDLMSLVDLENCLYNNIQMEGLADINYPAVDAKLKEEIRKSKDFINKVMAERY